LQYTQKRHPLSHTQVRFAITRRSGFAILTGTISIYSLEGRVLMTTKVNDQSKVKLQTDALPAGMYIVQLNAEDKTILRKFIKK